MSTSLDLRPTVTTTATADHQSSAPRRFFGVVVRPRSYRRILYLLLGLPLGTVWFSLLVTAWSLGLGLVVVALLGIPLLWATWYVVRACANVERAVANALVDTRVPLAPFGSTSRGNVWVRLRALSSEPIRWRELGFLLLRFPLGIATFAVAVTALATPFLVAYAPFEARYADDPFGHWSGSERLQDIASSQWAWLAIPLAALLLVTVFHLLDALAGACGRLLRWMIG